MSMLLSLITVLSIGLAVVCGHRLNASSAPATEKASGGLLLTVLVSSVSAVVFGAAAITYAIVAAFQ